MYKKEEVDISEIFGDMVFDDDTMKEKMAKCVENKYDELQNRVENEIDKAKLNGYKYYSMFFTKAPVVFAIVEQKRVSTMLTILENSGMTKEELHCYDNRSFCKRP